VDETIHIRHTTKDAAEKHARMLRDEGFDADIRPDDDRWLVTAHRDNGADDAYTVTRLETF